MAINFLGTWIRALISVLLLAAGIWLVHEFFHELPTRSTTYDALTSARTERPLVTTQERLAAWKPSIKRPGGLLLSGMLALVLALGGGRMISPWLWRRGPASHAEPTPRRVHRLATRNGYSLHVEEHGGEHLPPLILIHGSGSDRTQWREAVEDLSHRYRIYAYDLLGHGRSDHVSSAEHTIDASARDLDDVVTLAGLEGLVVAGHSMGGMIAMKWCALHPARARQIAALAIVHSTPQNPFTTMDPVALNVALQKPVHEPLLRMTIALSALTRVALVMEYFNGMSHWRNDMTLFGGTETREQLERTARINARMDPGAVARFALSMARFDVRKALPKFTVPTWVIAAAQDGTTRPDASRTIASLIPGAHLVMLPRTKHMGFMERRAEFAREMAAIDNPRDRARGA